MNPYCAILGALVLDFFVGDPVTILHPVRLIGRLATAIERPLHRLHPSRSSGALAWLLVVVGALLPLGLLLAMARRLSPYAEALVGTLTIYCSIAPRDLATHARRVQVELVAGDLQRARQAVACLVGRDTDTLDPGEVARAAVESVAESTVDAVTAPLFWAIVLGPIGALLYRVTNTLDSMWGHRDERYARFGFLAARADDVMNWFPARLTLGTIALSAALLRLDGRAALKLGISQGPSHPSPNSGLSEAAFAGALGVTLGGANYYDGKRHEGTTFGGTALKPRAATIALAVRLMWLTTVVTLAVLVLCRSLLLTDWRAN